MKSILIYFLVLILTSCATPQSRAPTIGKAESAQEAEQQVKLTFEKYLDQLNRVNIIATKIRISNADLCSDFSSPYYGFDVWTIQDYKNAESVVVPAHLILSDTKGDYLFVVENGLAKKNYVTRGYTTGDQTEIREGLVGTEILVDKGFREVGDNFSVNVSKQ